jgi:conjugal transfer pilus assembly protein TraD
MYEHDREHFQKMIASLLPIMNMLTSGDLGDLLSPDSNDPHDTRLITDSARVIRSNQVLYVGLDSLSDSMVGQAIGSIILSDLTAVAGDRYNYGLKNNRVNVYVDEVSEVINLPLIQTLNKGRGAGYNATLATQTFADFAAALGDENKARQVLGNINNLISLRVTDAETQKYICDSLPTTRVKYVMQTQGTNSANDTGQAHSGNIGERLMEEEVEMIPPQILGQLPDLEFFARLVDGRLLKGRIPILTREAA